MRTATVPPFSVVESETAVLCIPLGPGNRSIASSFVSSCVPRPVPWRSCGGRCRPSDLSTSPPGWKAPALPRPVTILMRSQMLILAICRISVAHLVELAEELLDLVRLGAAAGGDAAAAADVDDVGIAPLLLGHRVDHALDARKRLLGVLALGDHVAHAGHAADHVLHGPIFFICSNCLRKSSSVKSPLASFFCCLFDLLLADLLLDPADLLDQAHHVALAEDALGHALGTKLLQPVQLLADADELDRHLGDFLDRQGRAAAGVAVELGQDDAVEFQGVVERLGAVDGVLAGHGVADEVDLVRLDERGRSASARPSASRRRAAGRRCRG